MGSERLGGSRSERGVLGADGVCGGETEAKDRGRKRFRRGLFGVCFFPSSVLSGRLQGSLHIKWEGVLLFVRVEHGGEVTDERGTACWRL